MSGDFAQAITFGQTTSGVAETREKKAAAAARLAMNVDHLFSTRRESKTKTEKTKLAAWLTNLNERKSRNHSCPQ